MIKQIFTFLCLGFIMPAVAQERTSDLDSVRIQGKFMNIPYQKVIENVEVITKKDIEISSAKTIDELLQQVNGVDVRRRGADGVQSDVAIRGGSFEQVLILINGIRMNDSQTGHNSLNIPVDLSQVERIEIIKGPAARRFGNSAFAGAINIITKTSTDEKVRIAAEGADFKTYGLGIGATFGNEKMSNLFQVNSKGSEGYRHNTDYKINNIFYQNKFNLKNGFLGFQAGFQEKKFGANGFYASPKLTEQYEEAQASVVSISHNSTYNHLTINNNVFWRRGQDMYLLKKDNPAYYRNMSIGNNIGGEINAAYTSSMGTTGLGVELRKEFFVSNNLNGFTKANLSMGSHDRFITQVFLEHRLSLLNHRLAIVPGITWANYSNAGNFFYPGLDAGFDITEHHKIYGNVSQVHRIPTFTDLYYTSSSEVGNKDLKPESALSAELGYRYMRPNVVAKLSGFLRDSQKAIDWVKMPPSTIWSAQNIGNIYTKGIEAEFEHRPMDWLKYSAGYTYLDSNYATGEGLTSKYAADYLKHQFTAKWETRFLRNFTNELVYRYNERVGNGSYILLDGKLNYRANSLDIYVLVNNITNTKYTEAFGVPMPGRWFHAGFAYTIGL